jgi:hypothetical protein
MQVNLYNYIVTDINCLCYELFRPSEDFIYKNKDSEYFTYSVLKDAYANFMQWLILKKLYTMISQLGSVKKTDSYTEEPDLPHAQWFLKG